jgi:hypothetical protein
MTSKIHTNISSYKNCITFNDIFTLFSELSPSKNTSMFYTETIQDEILGVLYVKNYVQSLIPKYLTKVCVGGYLILEGSHLDDHGDRLRIIEHGY